MQAVELRFSGRYWDSLLYDGSLYLFTREGELHIVDWDRLISTLAWNADARPVARQLLTRGRAWYSTEVQDLLRSPSTRSHLVSIAESLTADGPIEVSQHQLAMCRVDIADAPMFPHTDLEAYQNRLFVGGTGGIYETDLAGREISYRNVADVPALRLAAAYGSLAVAAGSEGLWEQPVHERWSWRDAEQVGTQPCSACSWVRFDIVGSGAGRDAGYIAGFTKPRSARNAEYPDNRTLIGTAGAEALFGRSDGYMFGSADSLVLVADSAIYTDRWNPYRRRENFGLDFERSMVKQGLPVESKVRGEVLDASACVFGLVVERETGLVVLGSDTTTQNFREPINWRVFPRSTRYINQLHLIYTNHLRVLAYFHDYLLDSSEREFAVSRPRQIRVA